MNQYNPCVYNPFINPYQQAGNSGNAIANMTAPLKGALCHLRKMQGVMISIKPKWCKLIASGKKTIELRKSMPKLDVPFKCYIYCTADKKDYMFVDEHFEQYTIPHVCNGKVIGEFDCNNIDNYIAYDFIGAEDADDIVRTNAKDGGYYYWIPNKNDTCLTSKNILEYGNGRTLYGWYISNLKIYDKRKSLTNFA